MNARIGSSYTTDPQWIDKKLMNNQEITSAEQKIADRQSEAMKKTQDILNQTVRKGDWKQARKQEAELKEHFKSLSPEEKQFMYNLLQSRKGMSGLFHYRLATPQRERLLKALNPEHVTPKNLQGKKANETKVSMMNELDLSGLAKQDQLYKKILNNVRD